jgi:ribosomal RNA-processing protein 12
VLYGSESELDDSDDEAPAARSNAPPKRKGADHGARLRIDDDEPMDLLQGAVSRVTSMFQMAIRRIFGPDAFIITLDAQSSQRRKPGQDAARFKTDEDTGKMMIDSDSDAADGKPTTTNVAGSAYRESITSVDGFTRGPNGRIKFNKDTKKRRRENNEAEDVEMDVEGGKSKNNKRKSDIKLGHEFKAKVTLFRIVGSHGH